MIDATLEFVKQYGGLGWVVAGLALVFNVFQFFYKRHSNRVALSVSFSNGALTYPNGELSDMMLFLKIANTGNKKVVLNSVTLHIKSRPSSRILNGYGNLHSMPYTLEPGYDYQVWYEVAPMAKILKTNRQSGKIAIHGEFTTQAYGKFKTRKAYELDVDNWAGH